MTTVVRFDDSLPILVDLIATELGGEALRSGIVLRDAMGRLSFFCAAAIDSKTTERVSTSLRAKLGVYARDDRVLAGLGDYGVDEVLNSRAVLHVRVHEHLIRLVDRRLVGADWLRAPAPAAPPPPRFVFSSLKGGVGRSTALSVAAAELASHGRRVLAVDLDMEAPGLGAILLDEETLPKFGLVDALVENGLSRLDESFFLDMVGPSKLAAGHGRIDVIPAFGSRSLQFPGDTLAKIARAYVEDIGEDGAAASILDQVSDVISHFTGSARYDAILIDSRAGLHETAAAAILGLGADVYLFGLDDTQTFQGYSALLSHLARFIEPGDPAPDWLQRLTFVQGKAPASPVDRAKFVERCQVLVSDSGLAGASTAQAEEISNPAEPFHDVPWDDIEDHNELALDDRGRMPEPIAILDDDRFRKFEPLQRRDLVSEDIYRASYGAFLARINEVFAADEGGTA